MCDVSEVITQDRSDVEKIISEMLDNPEYGIYPTTKAFNQMERLLEKKRMEAVGWTWAEACLQLDRGDDPRKYQQGQLVDRARNELNPPWSPANNGLQKTPKDGDKN